ncbi:MAG TPA: hypothetical protein VIL04_13380 [Solirubrobacterales bacterium]
MDERTTIEVALTLDSFGWAELERRSTAEGLATAQLVARACANLRAQLGTERPALRVLRHQRTGGETRRLTLELATSDLLALKAEAERQDVALKDLLAHAVMLDLADSGD